MSRDFSRRAFVQMTGLGLVGAALPHAASVSENTKPNILILHADQHRIDCLGAYGNPDLRTPHIDALAADAIRYTNSFCPFPVCTPSRYSMLSGRYVHQHRGWDNHCTLGPGIATFPLILKTAGYRTKAVGKMHFTPTYLDVGFEEMILAEQDGPGRWDDDYHRALREAGLVDRNDLEDQLSEYRKNARPEYWEMFGALVSNLPEEYSSSRWIGDRAVETVETWGDSGNLLMAGFIKPHHPFDPPASFCNLYDPSALTMLPGWTEECFAHDLELHKGYFPHEKLTETALRRVTAYYYATIAQIDEEVGRIIGVLKRKRLYDNTLIVYTSDHGEYLGFHHLLLKGNHMYDPLMKVPLIIKYPGNRDRGTVSSALVNNINLAPTILGQAGCRIPEEMIGLNLTDISREREIIFAEASKGRRVMVRMKTRKLLLSQGRGRSLFFDLEQDPYETNNLYEDPTRQEEIAALTKILESWRSFDALPDTYLDENAPVIARPNVPARDDDHRPAMIAYFREKMART